MSGVEDLWDRLVRAALRGQDLGRLPTPAQREIADILAVADEIQNYDINVSRILCEQAYALAKNLDPDIEGTRILQFKTGLTSIIKQNLENQNDRIRDIDRSQDIARLREFYKLYREKEMKQWESGISSYNSKLEMERVIATSNVLANILEQLVKNDAVKNATEEIAGILRAADAIQDDDPNVSRILCEQAYSLAQSIDLKTGLMFDIKQRLKEWDGKRINRHQDIARLGGFYESYRQRQNENELIEQDMMSSETPRSTINVLENALGNLSKNFVPREARRVEKSKCKWVFYVFAVSVVSLVFVFIFFINK